jgi:hypothetical protein
MIAKAAGPLVLSTVLFASASSQGADAFWLDHSFSPVPDPLLSEDRFTLDTIIHF